MAQTVLPPTLTAQFSPATISPGGIAVLTLTMANPNSTASLNGVGGFSVDLSPLKMTSLGLATSGCVGHSGPRPAVATAVGSSTITVDPFFLPLGPGDTCSMPFNVFLAVDAGLGTQYAYTTAITSDNGGTGNTASAPITVAANTAPHLTVSVDASSIPQFGSTFLRVTPVNPNNGTLTGVAFTVPLPAGLTITGAGPGCALGSLDVGTTSFTLTAEAGTSLISVSDGILYPTMPCYVLVGVEGIGLGLQTITTSTITSTNGGTGDGASTSITVFDQVFQNGFDQN